MTLYTSSLFLALVCSAACRGGVLVRRVQVTRMPFNHKPGLAIAVDTGLRGASVQAAPKACRRMNRKRAPLLPAGNPMIISGQLGVVSGE